MQYLHTMVRVRNLEESLSFYCDGLGLREVKRIDNPGGGFTLVFLAAPGDLPAAENNRSPLIELTFNWDDEAYSGGRNFGHLAFLVDDIYGICEHLVAKGIAINRPPRDGHMAFVKSPDGISFELLQAGSSKAPAEPWVSMPNYGTW